MEDLAQSSRPHLGACKVNKSEEFDKYPSKIHKIMELPSPPGYSASINALHAEAARNGDPSLKAKRSWDIALGPIKQVSSKGHVGIICRK